MRGENTLIKKHRVKPFCFNTKEQKGGYTHLREKTDL